MSIGYLQPLVYLRAVNSHRFNQSHFDNRSLYHGTAASMECLQAPLRTPSSPDCSRLVPDFLCPIRHRSSVGRVTVDLIRWSWVRFPPRSKEVFLYLVWFPDSLYYSFTGFTCTLIYTSELILCSTSYLALNPTRSLFAG